AQHNALEESILKRNACPTLREHQAIHQVSLSKLQALLQDIGAGKGDARALSQVIVDWMSHHIFEHDLPSKAYMKDPLEANDS
ncbi:MAG: hypothetical protein K9J77_01350, partial [Rhodoferax sp.]|nr:hypothetical protein [Rhodoferax sp.]